MPVWLTGSINILVMYLCIWNFSQWSASKYAYKCDHCESFKLYKRDSTFLSSQNIEICLKIPARATENRFFDDISENKHFRA